MATVTRGIPWILSSTVVPARSNITNFITVFLSSAMFKYSEPVIQQDASRTFLLGPSFFQISKVTIMADSLKILVLHGYRQSAQTCKEKLGAFRKGLKKLPLEFVYITAPNKIPCNDGGVVEGSNEYGWWFSTEDDTYDPLTPTDVTKGFGESLEVVKTTFNDKGPFDGVLGFSQGACFLSILCALREQGDLQFKFAILVAGFKSRSTSHGVYYSTQIKFPTLHVFGDTDKVIPKENSEVLLQHYSSTTILNHPGGHFIPTQAPQRKVYAEFLQQFIANT
ncbi:esterase OVCA2-like isoform X1 [Acropora palmata]|uniref:esterase OVCA2-like isoform X1 n=1 Tax=Acropora palmata TaxID=6131 RepID=UPI003DA1A398